MFSQASSCIKVGNKLGQPFTTNVGLRQGDPMSPLIFNLFIADLVQKHVQKHQIETVVSTLKCPRTTPQDVSAPAVFLLPLVTVGLLQWTPSQSFRHHTVIRDSLPPYSVRPLHSDSRQSYRADIPSKHRDSKFSPDTLCLSRLFCLSTMLVYTIIPYPPLLCNQYTYINILCHAQYVLFDTFTTVSTIHMQLISIPNYSKSCAVFTIIHFITYLPLLCYKYTQNIILCTLLMQHCNTISTTTMPSVYTQYYLMYHSYVISIHI